MISISGIPIHFGIMLLICFGLCLYRVWRGPDSANRIVAVDILGILVLNFCALMAFYLKRDFLMDIALAWGLLGFIGTLALAKHLAGRHFDG